MSQYVPKMSPASLCRLRRIAWAVDRPMTKTLDGLVAFISRHINQQAVCNACLDSSQCETCGLHELKKNQLKTCQTLQRPHLYQPVRVVLNPFILAA